MTYDPGARRPEPVRPTVAHAPALRIPAGAAARRREAPRSLRLPTSPAAVPVPPRRGRSAPIWIDRRARARPDRPRRVLPHRDRSRRVDHRDAAGPAAARRRAAGRSAHRPLGAGAARPARARGRVGRDRRGRDHARRRSSDLDRSSAVDDSPARDAFAAVVQAPIVEEFAKGLGVYLIFVSARRAFDGPIDGDRLRRTRSAPGSPSPRTSSTSRSASSRGASADVSATFFVRGILSPFAHVMFTSVTGFALGLAARRGRERRPGGRTVAARNGRRDRAARLLERLGGVPRLLRAVPHGAGAAVRRCSSSASSRCVARRRGSLAPDSATTPPRAGSPRRRSTCSPRLRPDVRRLAWARTLRGDRTATHEGIHPRTPPLSPRRGSARSPAETRMPREDEHVLLARTADGPRGAVRPVAALLTAPGDRGILNSGQLSARSSRRHRRDTGR